MTAAPAGPVRPTCARPAGGRGLGGGAPRAAAGRPAVGLIGRWWSSGPSGCCVRAGSPAELVAGGLLVAAVVAGSAAVRVEATEISPVAGWARGAGGRGGRCSRSRSDPVPARGTVRRLRRASEPSSATPRLAAGTAASSVPVLVIGDPAWEDVRLGAVVRFTGRLAPASSAREAAVLTGLGPPVAGAPPRRRCSAAAEAVRASVARGRGRRARRGRRAGARAGHR